MHADPRKEILNRGMCVCVWFMGTIVKLAGQRRNLHVGAKFVFLFFFFFEENSETEKGKYRRRILMFKFYFNDEAKRIFSF